MKIDRTVKRETCYIGLWVLVFSLIMEGVFLLIGAWDPTVLWGNLFGGAVSVGNFLALGITVQKAVGKDEKRAREIMSLSQKIRLLVLFVAALLGALLPCFNIFAALLPLLFPRIAILIRPLFGKKDPDEPAPAEGQPAVEEKEDGEEETREKED